MNKHIVMFTTIFLMSSVAANIGDIGVEKRARANALLAAQTYLMATDFKVKNVVKEKASSQVNSYQILTLSNCSLKVEVGQNYKARVTQTDSCF